MRTILLAATFVLAAPPSVAGKPAPIGTSDPEIAFVNISGGSRRYYQLRVSNEDGTGVSTIFSSRDIGQMVPHMGPRGDRTILLVQGGKVGLIRYEPTSSGTKLASFEALPPIGTSSGAQQVDFAPDGKKFVSYSAADKTLWIFDLETRVFSPLIALANHVRGFAFSRDSSAVLFLDEVGNEAVLRKVLVSGGAVTDVGIRGDYWGIEPAHQSESYVLVRGLDYSTSRIEYHPADGGSVTDLAQGYAPSLQCDDSTVIYQKVNSVSSTVSLLRVEVASKAGATTSTSGNYWPDYTGC